VFACASVKSHGGQRGQPAESVGPHTLVPKIEALKAHIAQIRADLRTWDEKFVGELEKCLQVIVSGPPAPHWSSAGQGCMLLCGRHFPALLSRSRLFECCVNVNCGEDPCASIVHAYHIAHVNNMMQSCPACELDVHASLPKRQQMTPLVPTPIVLGGNVRS
jgi:hypothetical protein